MASLLLVAATRWRSIAAGSRRLCGKISMSPPARSYRKVDARRDEAGEPCRFSGYDYNDYIDLTVARGGDGHRDMDGRRGEGEVQRGHREGIPQLITRNGRRAAVVVSAEEWERKTHRDGNLAEFFAGSPLRGSKLKAPRLRDGPRRFEL
jgi:hypothetical protein